MSTRVTLLVVLAVGSVSAVALRSHVHAVAPWRDLSPHHVRSIIVDRSVRLEVLDWGGSGQPLVLLGCYLTAHVYDDIAPKLRDRFHVYGITRRGIGASDQPADGYSVQRSADDVRDVMENLRLQNVVAIGTSCAGQILSLLGAQHAERLAGLVYLEAADDPTLTGADYDPPFPDPLTLPPLRRPMTVPDNSSFPAYRIAQRRDHGVAFPEAELREQFVVHADGSVGASRLSPQVRQAITVDSRMKPDYARIRVPVLAIYRTDLSFDEFSAAYAARSEQERAALRRQYDATRGMYKRWQQDLRAGAPAARIVELPGANLYMFLSNEKDVVRELRAFAATLRGR